jgi:hypothetical protein
MGLLELLFWSFVGGLFGSLFMDIASSGVQKLSGGSAALEHYPSIPAHILQQ